MAAQRPEPGRGAEEKQPEAAGAASVAPPASGGSIKAWIPLCAALVLMPVLAYAVTNFILVPRLQKALRSDSGASAEASKEKRPEPQGETGSAPSNGNLQNATLNKLLVNVAGTMGSRYLLSSITMVGAGSDFPNKVTEHEAQLRDMASGLLSTKTIADLEKPGARNLLRGELLAGFNSILGNPGVQEIYFTEFAIQ